MTEEEARREAEEERVVAEEERVVAEEVRQTQEGAGDTEVSRVEAESDRVVAEEKRRSMRFFYAKIAGLVAFPLAFVAFIPAVVGIVLMDRAREQNCREIQELKANERAEAVESYAQLDRTLRIFKIDRTAEIERIARDNRDRALERFAPRKC